MNKKTKERYVKRLTDLIEKYPNAKVIVNTQRANVTFLPTPGFWDGKNFDVYRGPINAIMTN